MPVSSCAPRGRNRGGGLPKTYTPMLRHRAGSTWQTHPALTAFKIAEGSTLC